MPTAEQLAEFARHLSDSGALAQRIADAYAQAASDGTRVLYIGAMSLVMDHFAACCFALRDRKPLPSLDALMDQEV